MIEIWQFQDVFWTGCWKNNYVINQCANPSTQIFAKLWVIFPNDLQSKNKKIKPPKIPKLFDKKEGTSFFPKNKKIREEINGYPLKIQNKIFGGFRSLHHWKLTWNLKITQLKRNSSSKNLHDFGFKC